MEELFLKVMQTAISAVLRKPVPLVVSGFVGAEKFIVCFADLNNNEIETQFLK